MRTAILLLLLLSVAGCCGPDQIAIDTEKIPVPILKIDTLWAAPYDLSPEAEIFAPYVDSLLSEIATLSAVKPLKPLPYTGKWSAKHFTPSGDSVRVEFFLGRYPRFAFYDKRAPLPDIDTTQSVNIQEYGFIKKVGLFMIGALVGLVVGAVGAFFLSKRLGI